jgi:ATP-binding protein involved in chromosome partitioning
MKDDFSIKGEVISALETIEDPDKEKNLVDAHMIEEVEVDGGVVDMILVVQSGRDRDTRFALEDEIYDSVEAIDGVREVKVKTMTQKALERERQSGAEESVEAPESAEASANTPDGPTGAGGGTPAGAGAGAPGAGGGMGAGAGPAAGGGAPGAAQEQPSVPEAEPLEGVGHVLAVASGKGGVGKSTVAVNTALALQELGHRVGVLDVDIYGPSLPTLLGVDMRPSVSDNRITPIKAHGLSIMSLGFLMDDDTPVIWRGPIVTAIIRQFLRDVDWSGLDYLVVDMPPGTGDAQLALAQTVPVDGAMVVTTPSELARIDAARGFEMFNTLNVEVMGVVSNMSRHVCPDCGHESHIFGEDTIEEEVERLDTELLGDIPLDPAVRKGGDRGEPIVVGEPESSTTESFLQVARRVNELKPIEESDGDDDTEGEDKGLFSFLKE